MLKIRRPLGRLIFNMEITIPGKTVFLIETAPRCILFQRASNVENVSMEWRHHATYGEVVAWWLYPFWHQNILWCLWQVTRSVSPLQWHHKSHGASNHRQIDCLFNNLFKPMIMTTYHHFQSDEISSLTELEVVILTVSSAASDGNFVKIAIFSFQWSSTIMVFGSSRDSRPYRVYYLW